MLGVRHVGVTKAASALQNDGLVSFHRGELTILDLHGLQGASCSCYVIDKANWDRTMNR